MTKKIPRVAFFSDSFLEVNGVAMTINKFVEYAQKKDFPFLCFYGGKKNEKGVEDSIIKFELKRSLLAIPMDASLKYDPLFQRHNKLILKELIDFKPDLIHITGLNDVSISGAYLAWKLQIPVIASWHTNLHEFASNRLKRMFRFLPSNFLNPLTDFAERKILDGAILYYKMGQSILAPNQELVEILSTGTKRAGHLMLRGVETDFFSPEKRTVNDNIFRFGFVGRLRAEKNVRLLSQIEAELIKAGKENFEFVIVGDGNERVWLEKNMRTAKFTGFLQGDNLVQEYANMDCFIFPSETETFGNVINEANASGVPVLVTDQGGPKFIVKNGETGFICHDLNDFIKHAIELLENQEKLNKMRVMSRQNALLQSWDSVFEKVYETYQTTLEIYHKRKSSNYINGIK